MLALQAVTPEFLANTLGPVSIADARRILAQVHRAGHLETPLANVRRAALASARDAGYVPRLEVVSRQHSSLDPFVKLAFRVPSGEVVESVRIPLEKPGRFSVCVSSQVGCALACRFCATGRMGLKRNLEVWEIVEQVRELRGTLDPARGERVHGVVFQGMGEPLANLDRVLNAIAVLSDPSTLAIDARNMTVCTSGLPTGIRRLAREAPRVRLGWSLGSALRETRRRLMPIDEAHPFPEVLEAVIEHTRVTRRSPMWALTLLADVNDGEADAQALADLIDDFSARAGRRPRLTVIPYNSIDSQADPFERSSREREDRFREILRERGIGSHRRYSGGGDVGAACGQLAARAREP
ncbi:MAG: 23S rRNA (adenine(2503)-C(2))-methyltransferase RlmN [Polyangiaceae bacterium]